MVSLETHFKNNRQSKRANLLIPILVIFISIAIGFGSYSNSSFFKNLNFFSQDRFMKTFASKEISDEITIIDIDETSLAAIGQWPWPRYRLARMIDILYDMQPKAMGLDIILPEPDRTSLNNIKKQFQTDFDLNLKFTGVPLSLSDNDGYLAHIFKKTSIVGARYFYFDHFNKTATCKYNPLKIADHAGSLTLYKATGMLCNTFQLGNSLEFSGFINNQYDEDGILRQTPLLIEFQGDIFTHLSLSTFLKAYEIKQVQVLKDRYGPYIKAGNYKIPITKNGNVQVQFNGPGKGYKYISALDIINNKCSLSDIKDKIILIGSSAIGLDDIHHTIYDSQFPGVEINAVIIDNILKNKQIRKPIWTQNFIFGICIATGIIMAFLLFNTSGPAVLFLGTLAWICVVFISSVVAYMKLLVFISPGLPVLIAVVNFSFFSYVRFAITRKASFRWFKQLVHSQQLTIEAMVSIVETRDPETGQHIKRTQYYVKALAQYLKNNDHFLNILTDEYLSTLFLSVPLHDIGKVGVPDRILLKPGKLTDEEFEVMKMHASYGRDTIARVANKIKGDNYLKMGAEVAGAHHERWDGKGYPEGLSKEQIPLSGRMMAISDVYDALISKRCYKSAFSHEKSMEIILEGRGSLFDPVIVDAFFAIEPEIKTIASKFKDNINKAPEELKKTYTEYR